MNEISCENILTAKMAELDGEETGISFEKINSHLSICKNCQTEFEQMRTTGNLLRRQTRREHEAKLWSAIEKQISAQTSSAINWKMFVLIGALLIGYKLLEMLPARDLGLAFKIVPLVCAAALFVFLKENPFKINAELGLER